MGTYTELVLKCSIKDDRPQIVHEVLTFLFGKDSEQPTDLPDHPFFKKRGWEAVGRSGSYYHCPAPTNFYDGKYLFSRSDFKNYDDEIDSFLEWLKPYLSNAPGKFIGWIFCEQVKEPIFIYNDGHWDDEDAFKGWDNFAKDSLVSMAKFIIDEGHGAHEYQYAESSIMNSLYYLKSKRREKNEELSPTSQKADRRRSEGNVSNAGEKP